MTVPSGAATHNDNDKGLQASQCAAREMRRRTVAVLVITAVLLTNLGWTDESGAQTKLARVGVLSYGRATADDVKQWLEPFRRKLADQGWREGQKVGFEYRHATGDPTLLAEAAADLTRLEVDVIVADSAPALRAAHAATFTIPIVAINFTTDPIAAGYVESYSRPRTNITGVFLDAPEFSGKWLELLKAIVPNLSRAVVLWDPSSGPAHVEGITRLARSFRIQLQVIDVRNPEDIDRSVSVFRGRPQALIILPSPMMFIQSGRLANIALKQRLPGTSMNRGCADAGGTISYGPERVSTYERCAVFVAKILGGAKPGDLPLERPSNFELIVNLKTAKALGLTLPQSVLLRANEIIR